MFRLIAFIVMFSSGIAFASGKLIYKPIFEDNSDTYKHSLALSIYEKIAPGLSYVSWSGYGAQPNENDDWLITEQGVETYLGPVGIGLGGSVKYTIMTRFYEPEVYAKFSYKIWD